MSLMYRSMIGALCALTLACSKTPELSKVEGFAQGTTYHLTFVLPADSTATLTSIEQAVNDEFARMDKALSNYRDDSNIEQFNAQKTTDVLAVDAELVTLVEEARKVHRASNGCYDLTIKPLFDLWGFKKDVFSPPSDTELAQTMAVIGLDNLETLDATHLRKEIPNLRIDISSIGQGYSVGQIVKVLEQFGVQDYLVEIGGELQTKGKKPDGESWRIALEKPLPNERKMHKIVSFDSGAPMSLMASGTYRHYFDSNGKRYSHILDARSGKPIEHNTVSVAVLHPNPTIADAWSTALLCLGSSEGLKAANDNNLAALFIDQQGEQLIESQSKAMDDMKDVSFKQP
ncbi:MAG: FAD:protein transferase [Cellvibrio sp.]|jgi:thiamine biosynthesis lipoprotein|nr:FAD:protein transferase [Cellvibrio sp.]